jgi:hypothetical protein
LNKGNGFTISLRIPNDLKDRFGLFSELSGKVKNLNIKMNETIKNLGNSFAFGVVSGYGEGSMELINVHLIESEIKLEGKDELILGALIGYYNSSYGDSVIKNCSSKAILSADSNPGFSYVNYFFYIFHFII